MRELGIIADGAVLISDGKIVAVGTTDEVGKHMISRRIADGDRLPRQGCASGLCRFPHSSCIYRSAPVDFEKRIAGASYEEIAEAGGGIRASLRGVREASQEQLAPTL